ncbi:MAG TPA: SMC-Scp complex subunit ScpB [Acidobacteriaceae bacterium]|nr:SMC-Scp complex subunit ScpB [Acidobacteriaceae bacterium]
MSLKARIEAVIYAAEEPVTLQQLAAIFGDEAVSSARLALQGNTSEPASGEPLPSEPAAHDSADAEVSTPDFAGEPQPRSGVQPAPEEAPFFESPSPAGASGEDEKKAARQRDREIRIELRRCVDELIAEYAGSDRGIEIRDEIRRLVDELIGEYSAADRGIEIREVAGGYRMATRAEYHDAVRAFVKSLKPPMKLSLQALETLAVIAYKQPITAPEISEIRGVDSAGVLGSLIARKLITTAGRKQVIGRPILYKTTKEFLLRFGLKDLNELPSIEEFEKMTTELAESEQDAVAIAPAEKELPFAPEEAAEAEQLASPYDPKEPAPPMDEPRPVPEPPIGEPPAEPNPAPTTEHDASEE